MAGTTQTVESWLYGVTCASASDCWAVGTGRGPAGEQALIEQYTGTTWASVASPNTPSMLYKVACAGASDCWAVGNDLSNNSLLEQYTGTAWAVVSNPSLPPQSSLNDVTCVSASDCLAVGGIGEGSNPPQAVVEQDTGSGWAIVSISSFSSGAGLSGVTCAGANDCWAVGAWQNGTPQTLIEQNAGSGWNIVNPTSGEALTGVACVSAADCWTVGSAETLQNTGAGWVVVRSPNLIGLASVACPSTATCWAVGAYGAPYYALILRHTLGGWAAVGIQQPQGGTPTAMENPGGGNPSEPGICPAQGSGGDPCNTASGSFSETYHDLSVPGRGIPLDFTRTYSSVLANANGPLGYGWSDTYNVSLSVNVNNGNVTVHQETGAQVTFMPVGNGQYSAPARVIATLIQNGDGSFTFARDARSMFTFNPSLQLTAEQDLNGYRTTLTYPNSTTTVVTDPEGRTLTLAFSAGQLQTVTDPIGRIVRFTYDVSGNLFTVSDVQQNVTKYTYDPNHLLLTITDPRGAVTTNTYTSSRVTKQVDGLKRATTFAYTGDYTSAAGGTTTVTDPKGNVTLEQYYYSLRSTVTNGYGTAAAATTTYTYDPATLAIASITDPNGQTRTMASDASGNLLFRTDPLGRTTAFTYDNLNNTLTTTDPNGVQTTMTYDANGNLLTRSTPLVGANPPANQVVTFNHSDGAHPGDVTSIVDPDGKIWTYGYDGDGYRNASTDPLGNKTTSTFNAVGWKLTDVSPSGNVAGCGCSSQYTTTYGYVISGLGTTDEWGDVQTITDPLGNATTYGYDQDRNKTSVKDADGQVTTYVYDLANQQTQVKRPDGTKLLTDYNLDGTVLDQKDGKGNATQTYGYNSLAQAISVKDALGNETDYSYDGAGNQLTIQAPGGSCASHSRCTTNTYDAANELTSVAYSDGLTPNVTAIGYDADSQKTSWTDGSGSWIQVFDSLHRLTSVTEGNSGTVAYAYDLRNLPTTITYPGGTHVVTETYDDAGRWTNVQDWNGNATTIGYDPNSNLTAYTLPAGTAITDVLTYNKANYLTSILDKKGTSAFFSATYAHDPAGLLTSDSSAPTAQSTYRYTSLAQVCYAGSANTAACASPPSGAESYAYDAADNPVKLNPTSTTQQFNAADELCWAVAGPSSNSCTTPPTGATSYMYDASGNRTARVPSAGTATCDTYDQANRLIKVSTGTGSSCTTPTTLGSYSYNASGLRMSKTVGGTVTIETWDAAAALPRLLEDKASGATVDYIYGPGGLPLEQIMGATTLWYHHDQLGSTRAITDAGGATKATYQYDPYGNTIASTGSVVNPFAYGGQYKDGESGLYYLRARYYDTSTAQFLTVDAMLATTLSPYGYASDSPVNGGDPSGNRPADFYLFNVSFAIFSFSIAVDSSGKSYVLPGLSRGVLPASVQGWAGWINPGTALNGPAPTEEQIHTFLTGLSGSFQATLGGGAGVVYGNPGGRSANDWALLIGLGSPQFGVTGEWGVAGDNGVCNPLFADFEQCQQRQAQATLSAYGGAGCSPVGIRQRIS